MLRCQARHSHLTVELDDRKIMFPYAAFQKAELTEGQLVAFFGEAKLIIKGRNLEKLWEDLQLFEARTVRKSELESDRVSQCGIAFIDVE